MGTVHHSLWDKGQEGAGFLPWICLAVDLPSVLVASSKAWFGSSFTSRLNSEACRLNLGTLVGVLVLWWW